jgi:hypothetical protein
MATKKPTGPSAGFGPGDFHLFTGLDIPDPITFILGKQWLAQPGIYPRQATLIKVIFLREDLFTEYDYKVVAEWEDSYRSTGNNGITPNILGRMRLLKEQGYPWFREVLLVMGRRAGKGHVSALAMAYVLWNYLAKGDPQSYYGIARSKQLECLIYAGKKEQARKNLWQDLVNAIIDSHCFQPYVSRPQAETLTVFAPHDKVKMANRAAKGLELSADQATFRIEPKEATLMSGRGGASFMQGYDEMAHVVATGANRSAEEVYGAATPALDQFKKDAFIVEPSSPWQMIGQFYKNYQESLEMKKIVNEHGEEVETDEPLYPNKMMIQLTSWDIYKDWEISHTIDAFPRDFEGDLKEYINLPLPKFPRLQSAPQEYDDEMKKLEVANPDTFKVERLSHWATTMDAYLNMDKIADMWDPTLQKTLKGRMDRYYKGHGDPSSSNANFGLAVAHTEVNPETGWKECVFDYIHHWAPSDFPDSHIDYTKVMDELWEIIEGFPIDEFTIDQFNSGPILSMLHKKSAAAKLFKTPQIFEVTATAQLNWKKAEAFKTALNQGWIRAPYDEQADLELKFLQLVATATTMRVEKQSSGPVQTKDVADAMFECVYALLGDQLEAMKAGFTADPITGAFQGGITPFGQLGHDDEKLFNQFGGGAGRFQGADGFGGSIDPARGLKRQMNGGRGGW